MATFSEWKNNSKKYQDLMRQNGIGRIDAEEIARAAYKAGHRQGENDMKENWNISNDRKKIGLPT